MTIPLTVDFRTWAIYSRGNELRVTRNPGDNGMENAPKGWRAAVARQWGRTSVQASWVSDRPWKAGRPRSEFGPSQLSLYLSRFTLERVSIVPRYTCNTDTTTFMYTIYCICLCISVQGKQIRATIEIRRGLEIRVIPEFDEARYPPYRVYEDAPATG